MANPTAVEVFMDWKGLGLRCSQVLDDAGNVILDGTQGVNIVALVDSTGGTANGTVAQVADIALSTGDTYTDSAVNTAVNTALATLNDDLADIIAKQTAILTALEDLGLLADA